MLQIILNDNLPTTICHRCTEKLIDFHLFRVLLLESQRKLLDICSVVEHKIIDNSISTRSNVEFKNELYMHDVNNGVFEQMPVPFQCTLCSSMLSTQAGLKKHMKNIHKSITTNDATTSKGLICEKCEQTFANRSSFLGHFRQVHLYQNYGSKYQCPLCSRHFTGGPGYASNVNRHMKRVHMKNSRISKGQVIIESDEDESSSQRENFYNQTSIECSECKEICPNTMALYEHSRIHLSDCNDTADGYNLKCDECHIVLDTLAEFICHMCNVHSVPNRKLVKPIKCRWCAKRFARMSGLYTHVRFVHQSCKDSKDGRSRKIGTQPTRKPSLCTICGKFLTTSIALRRHLLIHSNSRPFQCDICLASFRQIGSLTTHMTIHKDERKYQCRECGKKFRQNPHLKMHLMAHGIGIEKWFSCTICHKKFYSKGNLTVRNINKSVNDQIFIVYIYFCFHVNRPICGYIRLAIHFNVQYAKEDSREKIK